MSYVDCVLGILCVIWLKLDDRSSKCSLPIGGPSVTRVGRQPHAVSGLTDAYVCAASFVEEQ